MNKSWGNPIHNGLDLIKIHVNTIFIDNMPKEFDFSLMEFASFQLNIESNFPKHVQNKSNMLMNPHIPWKIQMRVQKWKQ